MATPKTGEPDYQNDEDQTRPGASGLSLPITVTSVTESNKIWDDYYADSQFRNRTSAQFPNIADPFSPLDALVNEALMLFGNMAPETIESNVRMMMLRRANRIVEDIRLHPYSSLPDLDYYKSLTETRPIPDEIMIAGLTYHYAKWQDSSKAGRYFAEYYQTMNQILYQRKYGSGRPQLKPHDREEAPK